MTVGVHDLRLAVSGHRFFQSFEARLRLQCDREPPGQHLSAEPVHDRCQVDEPARHGDIGDVHGPDMVGPGHSELAQKVWVDLVAGRRFRGVRLPIQGFDAHLLHQRGDMEPTGGETLLPQQALHHPAAREGKLHVQFVDPAHQSQIVLSDRAGLIIQAAPADPEEIGLPREAQLVVSIRFARSLEPVAFTGSLPCARQQTGLGERFHRAYAAPLARRSLFNLKNRSPR